MTPTDTCLRSTLTQSGGIVDFRCPIPDAPRKLLFSVSPRSIAVFEIDESDADSPVVVDVAVHRFPGLVDPSPIEESATNDFRLRFRIVAEEQLAEAIGKR